MQPTAGVPPLDLNRPRDLGGLISTTFSLYGKYFAVFASIAFAVVVPVDFVFYGGMLGWFGTYDPTPPVGDQLIATYASQLIAQPLITAMHVAAVLAIGEGRRPTLKESFVRGGDVFLPVLGALLLTWFFTLLGFIALIIPGIYVLVRLWVVAPAVVVENRRGMDAIRRSWYLVKDNWWRILGITIVVGIIGGVGGAILSVPGTLIADATGSGPIALVGQIFGSAITYSFQALTATLIFFDLRARKEGPAAAYYGAGPQAQWGPPPPPGQYRRLRRRRASTPSNRLRRASTRSTRSSRLRPASTHRSHPLREAPSSPSRARRPRPGSPGRRRTSRPSGCPSGRRSSRTRLPRGGTGSSPCSDSP